MKLQIIKIGLTEEIINNVLTNNETANITNDELINIWYNNTLQ